MNHPSRIIVVGASAGGVEALKSLMRGLPEDFPAAVLVVIHVPAQSPSMLASILDRVGPLPALDAIDSLPIAAGHVYVAVPDRHLLVDGGVMRLSRGPRENRFRPSIDALFRSAAYTQGGQVVGVVLTGQLDDGTSGLWAIKDRGGIAIVQSPRDAQFPSMPMSALQHVNVDHVVDIAELPQVLNQLARERVPELSTQASNIMRTENEIAAGADPVQAGSLGVGTPTKFTCPECHGVLGQVREGSIVRFRCHTGHAYSMQSLLADVDESIDHSLWGVLRTLQERAMLLREAATLARERKDDSEADVLESRAVDCDYKTRSIRALLNPRANESGSLPREKVSLG